MRGLIKYVGGRVEPLELNSEKLGMPAITEISQQLLSTTFFCIELAAGGARHLYRLDDQFMSHRQIMPIVQKCAEPLRNKEKRCSHVMTIAWYRPGQEGTCKAGGSNGNRMYFFCSLIFSDPMLLSADVAQNEQICRGENVPLSVG